MPDGKIANLRADTAGPRIVAQTSYQWVRDALRDDIVGGVFEGDQKLTVSLLRDRYGVSAPPIREALSQLQVEGLVVIEANRGARVRAITVDFVREVFEIRIVLESALVERSVPLFKQADVEALSAIQDKFEAAVDVYDHPLILKLNSEFHRRIYAVRPNHEAVRLIGQHATLIATMRNRFGYDEGRFATIHTEHRALIAACGAHDVKRAGAIAREHIEHSVVDLVGRIEAVRKEAPVRRRRSSPRSVVTLA